MATPFDFVNQSKQGNTSIEGYAYFQVMTFLSSNVHFLPICQVMNSLAFSRLDDDIKARVTNDILRKFKTLQFQYPKQAKKLKDNSNNDYIAICSSMKCSLYEAKLYVEKGYISESDIKKMKEFLR